MRRAFHCNISLKKKKFNKYIGRNDYTECTRSYWISDLSSWIESWESICWFCVSVAWKGTDHIYSLLLCFSLSYLILSYPILSYHILSLALSLSFYFFKDSLKFAPFAKIILTHIKRNTWKNCWNWIMPPSLHLQKYWSQQSKMKTVTWRYLQFNIVQQVMKRSNITSIHMHLWWGSVLKAKTLQVFFLSYLHHIRYIIDIIAKFEIFEIFVSPILLKFRKIYSNQESVAITCSYQRNTTIWYIWLCILKDKHNAWIFVIMTGFFSLRLTKWPKCTKIANFSLSCSINKLYNLLFIVYYFFIEWKGTLG